EARSTAGEENRRIDSFVGKRDRRRAGLPQRRRVPFADADQAVVVTCPVSCRKQGIAVLEHDAAEVSRPAQSPCWSIEIVSQGMADGAIQRPLPIAGTHEALARR